jgi:hypothetical protein
MDYSSEEDNNLSFDEVEEYDDFYAFNDKVYEGEIKNNYIYKKDEEYDEILEKCGDEEYYDFNEISEELIDDKLCIKFLKKCDEYDKDIPYKYFTHYFCEKAIKLGYLWIIPKNLFDYDLYKVAFKHFEITDFDQQFYIKLKHIPKKFIDREMCLLSLFHTTENIKYIPKEYLDYNFYLDAVKMSSNSFLIVPKKFRSDDKMIKTAIYEGYKDCDKDIFKLIDKNKITYKLCKDAIKNKILYHYEIKYIPEKFINKNISLWFLNNMKRNYDDLSHIPKKYIKYNNLLKICDRNIFILLIFNTDEREEYIRKVKRFRRNVSYYKF